MPNLTTSSAVDTFMASASNAAALANLGAVPLTGGTLTGALTLPNAIFSGLSLTGAQATNTLDVSTTWSTTGNPTLIYGRATNTASGATARLIDVGTVAGGSLFSIDKTGRGFFSGGNYNVPWVSAHGGAVGIGSGNSTLLQFIVNLVEYAALGQTTFQVGANHSFSWSTGASVGNVSTTRTSLLSPAADTIQLGVNAASTATAQTIKAHNVTTGTGANLILSGGTGNVANGVVIISRLPTSNPGPGILWNNAGTPAIGT